MKKIVVCAIALIMVMPGLASAATNAELQAQIASLLAMIKQLQAQLASQTGASPDQFCHNFNTDLKIGDKGSDVDALVSVLTKEGLFSWDYLGFNETVASSVSSFQERYRSEILTPAGLSSPTGYVGGRTRAKLNALYGCAKPTPIQIIGPTPPIACTLEARLCPDGTYVSRTGPNCEFTPCPATQTSTTPRVDIKVGPAGSYPASFTDGPININSGFLVNLSWNLYGGLNPSNCYWSGGTSGNLPSSGAGDRSAGPFTTSQTIFLSCGSYSDSVKVNVISLPPVITGIESKASPMGTIYANEEAYIYGTGLSGPLTVKIGALWDLQTVYVTGISDTYARFMVPSRIQSAAVTIAVTNSSGQTSNNYLVNINVPSAQNSVQVGYPNGGEQFLSEKAGFIAKWKSNQQSVNVYLLWDDSMGNIAQTLGTNVSGESLQVNVGSDILQKDVNRFKLKVCLYANSSICDTSDSSFSFVSSPSTITVTSPNNGEAFLIEKGGFTARWTNNSGKGVDLYLLDWGSLRQNVQSIAQNVWSDSYSVDVNPQLIQKDVNKFYLQVCVSGTSICDSSDVPFSFVSSLPTSVNTSSNLNQMANVLTSTSAVLENLLKSLSR
ncbi:MAG: hypothetical protein US96_C0052G0002 [Candidatus Woesebacteria bacterium GW2011_GWB1_38_5b]|uniref:Peptidoglycan binding-like domain-containing protein n=2 Tax=Candidatus Woeseibacteriota TaxID=1752722 RepID=A0A0G0K250_9BACT|nr:MAG: hypothetical protein US96_C0052G0002 [Candidatus Woesebacteria bacterium GW2011_GWB1_38_5b]